MRVCALDSLVGGFLPPEVDSTDKQAVSDYVFETMARQAAVERGEVRYVKRSKEDAAAVAKAVLVSDESEEDEVVDVVTVPVEEQEQRHRQRMAVANATDAREKGNRVSLSCISHHAGQTLPQGQLPSRSPSVHFSAAPLSHRAGVLQPCTSVPEDSPAHGGDGGLLQGHYDGPKDVQAVRAKGSRSQDDR
eukprot:scaffold50_cov420-Prasinococcus_capsulatus_cf.AAC.24